MLPCPLLVTKYITVTLHTETAPAVNQPGQCGTESDHVEAQSGGRVVELTRLLGVDLDGPVMLFQSTRRIKSPPLSYVTSCVRRVLSSRRHSLWIILILVVAYIAIQNFLVHQARNDKLTLTELPRQIKKHHLFPALQNVWKDFRSAFLTVKSTIKSLRTARNPVLHHQKERYRKPSDYTWPSHADTIFNLATTPQIGTNSVSSGKLLLPNQRPAGLPGSSDRHSASEAFLSASRDETLINTIPQSNFLNAHFNSAKTKTCHRKSHIVFLKTHKTASSTILNILYRYGERWNLTFALPRSRHSQFIYPFYFASHFVEGVSSRSEKDFHILCNHMRFRKSEVAKVMPEDSFYFSILRHPVAMMESIFIYYKSIQAFQTSHTLDNFLDNTSRRYNSSVINNHYAHNLMAFDFGFDNNVVAGTEDLEERASMTIAAIQRDFHVILISEYFDESMILLKHALCWSLEDMVSFKLNSRSRQTRQILLPNTAEKIKQWNALDWRIYVYFNTTFWHRVDRQVGKDQMKKEVSQLRGLRAQLASTCLKDGEAVDPSQIKDAVLKPFQYGAAVIQGYNLNTHLDRETKMKCQRFVIPELQYTDHLYMQQFPLLSEKHRKANINRS
ncbi:galactose-3-O-sulfotransferase 2 [Brachionichthys hirsutus]|uniref:galactose-3-O-sulfotransferase 2 n=1 Tax=Brachionichthys hirsutus TaxID=412623 RepID=UPI003604D5C4